MYRGVCATCHSLNRIAFRNMDGVCYTTQEIKDMAAEVSGSTGASARFSAGRARVRADGRTAAF